MIHVTRVVDLEVSLASFGILEELLLKAKLVREKSGDVEKVSGLLSCPDCAGSAVSDCLASRSVYSLPTISEPVESGQVADIRSQEPCSSLQADEVLSSAPTACSLNEIGNLKTLKEITADLKKTSSNPFRWSSECHPNPVPGAAGDSGGFLFTKSMLALAPFAEIFASGPEDTPQKKHCSFCMCCKGIFP